MIASFLEDTTSTQPHSGSRGIGRTPTLSGAIRQLQCLPDDFVFDVVFDELLNPFVPVDLVEILINVFRLLLWRLPASKRLRSEEHTSELQSLR